MNIGDIIEVSVVEVFNGAALLEHEGMQGTLQLTELTWKAGPIDIDDYVEQNSSIAIRVVAIKGHRFSASLKRLGDNPWDNPPKLGETYSAQITRVTDYGYFARITWFCDALLHLNHSTSVHALHDQVMVRVIATDLHRKKIGVEEIAQEL